MLLVACINTKLLLKIKSSYGSYQLLTLNNWLMAQRRNMRLYSQETHAAAVTQLSNGTNGDDLHIRIAAAGNTILTV